MEAYKEQKSFRLSSNVLTECETRSDNEIDHDYDKESLFYAEKMRNESFNFSLEPEFKYVS